jgi:hypothetical protein
MRCPAGYRLEAYATVRRRLVAAGSWRHRQDALDLERFVRHAGKQCRPWRANSTPCSEPFSDQFPCEKLWGVMLLGEANREAPAQAELRPTCAGPAMSKRHRVEWASGVDLHLIFIILLAVGQQAPRTEPRPFEGALPCHRLVLPRLAPCGTDTKSPPRIPLAFRRSPGRCSRHRCELGAWCRAD